MRRACWEATVPTQYKLERSDHETSVHLVNMSLLMLCGNPFRRQGSQNGSPEEPEADPKRNAI